MNNELTLKDLDETKILVKKLHDFCDNIHDKIINSNILNDMKIIVSTNILNEEINIQIINLNRVIGIYIIDLEDMNFYNLAYNNSHINSNNKYENVQDILENFENFMNKIINP